MKDRTYHYRNSSEHRRYKPSNRDDIGKDARHKRNKAAQTHLTVVGGVEYQNE